jgi:hypothetical protein
MSRPYRAVPALKLTLFPRARIFLPRFYCLQITGDSLQIGSFVLRSIKDALATKTVASCGFTLIRSLRSKAFGYHVAAR